MNGFFNMKARREDVAFIVVLIVYAIIRFFEFTSWSLTNDELSALVRLNYSSLSELITQGIRDNDMHPMGVQLFLWCWTGVFGVDEWIVRLPFVLFGIGAMVFTYRAATVLFGKPSALLTVSLLAFLQYPAMYAELARPYSPGLFFSMLTLYGWSLFVRKPDDWKWHYALPFVAGGIGCMYVHYFSFLFAGLLGLCGFIVVPRQRLLHYVLSGLVMVVCYFPSYDVFITHTTVGGLGGPGGWLGKPGQDAIWNYLVHGFNHSPWLISVLVFSTVLYQAQREFSFDWSRTHSILLFLFLALPFIAYYYSLWVNPVFQYSVLLFSFPLGVMVMCSWFRPEQWKKADGAFYLFVTSLTFATYFLSSNAYREGQFASFRRVASACAEVLSTYGAKDVDATVNVIHPRYIEYYTAGKINFLQTRCNSPEDYAILQQIVDSSKAKHFLHAWSNNYHAPETEWIIQERFPYCVRRDTLFNAGVIVYSTDSTLPRVESSLISFEERNGFETLKWENEQWCRTDSVHYSGNWSMRLERDQPYSPGIKRKAAELGMTKDAVYFISCKLLNADAWREAKLVVSIERNGQSILWRGISPAELALSSGKWQGFFAGYKIQEDVHPEDVVAIYFYNPGQERFFMDDFRIQVVPPGLP